MSDDFSSELSIVIISRNEAKNIARAIESVFCAIKELPQTEILLVDSASTDGTLEIAKSYPINIIRLPSNWFLSVSAGRHIGMQYTRGKYILHMDGDMELDPRWVILSISFLLDHPEVGAVGGYWKNVHIIDGKVLSEEFENRDSSGQIQEARYVGGAALYRRDAIEQMGGFQPYIKGEEGVYISLGIRGAGYKVVMLPYLMSHHYCIPRQTLDYGKRKFRLGFMKGYGQVLRLFLGTKLFWTYVKERLIFQSLYSLGLISTITILFISLLSHNWVYLITWLLFLCLVLTGFTIKKRSIKKAWSSIVIHTWITISTFCGFFNPPRDPSEYPINADVIQVANHHGAMSKTIEV